ncbi:O-antigen ligase family protein [Nonomuraea sp. NPDC059194]|uniref:O-antigen ligase family protein n=1 Tax=Nonomuraea sp. NPDC059194 TaxID=3346764 RepID=UPI0036C23556
MTAVALAPPGAARARAARDLPVWPLGVLFAAFPLWWVLGLGAFVAPIAAVPMAVLMVRSRRRTRIPRGFLVWVLFLLWMVMAATQLDSGPRLVGFAFRLAAYVSATIFFLYVYNCSNRLLPAGRASGYVTLFCCWVVIGGYLGVLFPEGSLTTPFEKIVPGSIATNEFVKDLVHPKFAEIQAPWGSPEVFERPSAPFAYTNAWGSHWALLMPFVLHYLLTRASGWRRAATIVIVPLSLVPAFSTLNRGMFLAIGLGLVYVALRFAMRGHVRWLGAVCGVLLVGMSAFWLSGLSSVISTRTQYSSTNTGRAAVYGEAFTRTLESPILGHGAPRPSETLGISVGTQGQFWNIMFSFGFPALILFCVWIWILAWRTRRVPASLLWLHAVPVMAAFMVFYYGLDGTQLVLIFTAGALALRPAEAPS